MPFILGLHTSAVGGLKGLPIDEVMVVDLDKCKITGCPLNQQDILLVPDKLLTKLKEEIDDSLFYFQRSKKLNNEELSRFFREFFLGLLSGYQTFFKVSASLEPRFNLPDFLLYQSRDQRRFSEVFCETQMFQRWVQEIEASLQSDSPGGGLFDREALAWEETHSRGIVNQVSFAFNKYRKNQKQKAKRYACSKTSM